MHRFGNFAAFLQPNYEKSVGKGCAKIIFSRWCPYSKGNFRWSTRVKGTLWVPPQPGCPRVCPPWAHRSYATATMPDVVVDQEGVLKLLKDIKVNKAVGPDGIPNKALKLAADEIAPVITFIFQQSLDESYLPEDWRRADITPIFKKGSKAEPSNYRPVSLTTVLCKHLEHIIDSQMMSHFDSHGVLSDCQHAFRKMRSCETQLITTLHDLATNHNKSITTDIAVPDFSKAFDVVPHQHLLLKLDY